MDRDEILKKYYTTCVEIGRWLAYNQIDWKAHGLPTYTVIKKYFDSIPDMRDEAERKYGKIQNLRNNCSKSVGITNEELIRIYFEESKKAGYWLRGEEVNTCNAFEFSAAGLCHRFLGLNKLRAIAARRYHDLPTFQQLIEQQKTDQSPE